MCQALGLLTARHHSPQFIDKETEALIKKQSHSNSKICVLSSPQGSPDLPAGLSSFTAFCNLLLCLLTIVPVSKILGQRGGCSQEDPENSSEPESKLAPERASQEWPAAGKSRTTVFGVKRKEQGGVF